MSLIVRYHLVSLLMLAFNFGTSQLPVFSRQLFRSLGVWEFLDSQFVVKAVAKKIQSAAWLSSSCCLNPSRPLTSPYSLWSLWCCRTMQNQLSGFWMVLAVPLAGCGWACVEHSVHRWVSGTSTDPCFCSRNELRMGQQKPWKSCNAKPRSAGRPRKVSWLL